VPRKKFVERLQQAVETATAQLVTEGRTETSAK
jgi:hypothetical protein